MPLPGLFPIYPENPIKFHVSLAIPMGGMSDIAKSLGVTASYPLLIPNVDFLQNFIKGDIGIANKIMLESLFQTFNHPAASNNEKVFKSFSKVSGSEVSDVNKYKKNGKIKIPKTDVKLPQTEAIGFKGFEKTLLTSIFETQKPYFDIAKLVIGNVAKIEDIVARIMPLLSPNPLKAKSEKPTGNGGISGGRPKAIGYQSGIELKAALSKLQSLSVKGKTVNVDKDGKASRDFATNQTTQSDASGTPTPLNNYQWQILSVVYSTGIFRPEVNYKYTYVDLPAEPETPNTSFELGLEDDGDPYKKYKPKNIILGIFKSDGTPLNPSEKLKSIGVSNNGFITDVDTPYSKAGWILESSKWKFPSNQYVWPTFGTPNYIWKRIGGNSTLVSKTRPSDDYELKKYKEGEKNLLNGLDAIVDDPIISSFDAPETSEYSNFFSDLTKFRMNQADGLEQSEKNQYSNQIIGSLNVSSHLENVFLYGQSKASVYNSVNGQSAFPNTLKLSLKPFQVYSSDAANDVKLSAYAISQGKQPGFIWIDPESDYETKVIRVDPTTQIQYEEAQDAPEIQSSIKSFVKNRALFKISNDSAFDVSISKNGEDPEIFTNANSYTLENWNYFKPGGLMSQQQPIIQNNNSYDIKIYSQSPSKYYSNRIYDVFEDEDGIWTEVKNNGGFWSYRKFEFTSSSTTSGTSSTPPTDPYTDLISNADLINQLYQIYLQNNAAVYSYTTNLGLNLTVQLQTLFVNKITYLLTSDGIKNLRDGSRVEVVNDNITRWIFLEKTYDATNLPPFNKQRTFILEYDLPVSTSDPQPNGGDLIITESDIDIPAFRVNVVAPDFTYGKIIDPSKITNDQLKTPDLFSTGKYGHGDADDPQNIDVIKRFMLTDLDTESYFIIEGVLTDENNQGSAGAGGVGAGGSGSGGGYYRLPHAIGAMRVFLSILVDIFSKLIPGIVKLLKLFKNPASFVTDVITEKMGDGFSIYSKDALKAFAAAKNVSSGGRPSDKVNNLRDLFKNSPLSNHVYVDNKARYKFLLDGVAMMPFEIFGLKIPFGMELNLPNTGKEIRLIYDADLPKSKVQNLQQFLRPSLKTFKGPGSNGVGSPLDPSQLQDSSSPQQLDLNYPDEVKHNLNDYEIIDIKYSTGEYINGIDYNWIYITLDAEKALNDVDKLLTEGNTDLAMEKLNSALQQDPTNAALLNKKKDLKDFLKGMTDSCQPLLKMLLGLVTLPIKIIAGIIQWIMDFFKSLTNPLALPAKMAEFLSFSWIMKFFTPMGILDLAGVKLNPGKIAEWIAKAKDPNTSPDEEIADLSEFLSMPFMPKLPTYTARQLLEHPERPFKIFWPFICMIEGFINGIIDFIWSLLGIEAIIPAPHIKICNKSKDAGQMEAENLMNILNGSIPNTTPGAGSGDGSTGDGNTNPDDTQGFIYDITLDDGRVIRGLNYEELQNFMDENQDISYDLKF